MKLIFTTIALFQNENVTDCRGELASYAGEGRFPIENTLGLPLANPPPPRDHPQLKPVYRFFSKFLHNFKQ